MKLVLASSGKFLGYGQIDQFLGKPLTSCKILYITTATKNVTDLSYSEKTLNKMNKLGISYHPFDLENKSSTELIQSLEGIDIIYFEGGNTFHLLKIVRETGFDKILLPALERGLIYWGVSAGSYLPCPSIEVATWANLYDSSEVEDFTGLNLVPFFLKAHLTPDKKDFFLEKAKFLPAPCHLITDDQAILCDLTPSSNNFTIANL